MIFHETPLADVRMIELESAPDECGRSAVLWSRDEARAQRIEVQWAQTVAHVCDRRGTLRGMHYRHPVWDAKLVRVVRGSIVEAIVDLRSGSETFGGSFCMRMDARRGIGLYVPEGFAHGFMALEDDTEVHLQLSVPHLAEHARGFRFDDPQFAIAWPEGEKLLTRSDLAWGEFRSEELR